MNLKVYEKTRYQNIYRHKKNKNYIVKINTPVDTTITNVNDSKILKLEDAIKIRDNPKLRLQKEKEVIYKDTFDDLWEKYIYSCKYENKRAYNTLKKKEKIYNTHLKGKINLKVSKINKDFILKFIESIKTTDKQKNEIMKQLKAFFYWCLDEEYIINNPMQSIKMYKVQKAEMKYWQKKKIKKYLDYTNYCIDNDIDKEIAYRMKIIVLIGFSIGDRIGETRALSFDCIDKDKLTLSIMHSINYDTKSSNFLGSTKTYWSQRVIDISQYLIDEIDNYKLYLKSLGYNVKDNNLIIFNYKKNKPYSDCTLRKEFNRYCHEADVSKIRMYDLRHTFVATMMSEGQPLEYFSKKIGHKKILTTVDEYGHLSNKVRREMAEFTDKFVK